MLKFLSIKRGNIKGDLSSKILCLRLIQFS